MAVALIVGLAAAVLGWQRAARRGGGTADKLQFAAAHGIPAFLVCLIVIVFAARFGMLG